MSTRTSGAIDIDQTATGVRPVAVIDIGASSIRMAIAEIHPNGSVNILERLVQTVSLGKDTFTRRNIRKATIESCVRVLRQYQQKLREYRIEPEQIRVVATSAVREAANRMAFLDRIYIATGLTVEPIQTAEVARITYLGIQPLLQSDPALASKTTLITEVGGGTTDVLVLRDENVVHSQTYRLGSLRLRETLEAFGTRANSVRELMETHINRTIQHVRTHAGQTDNFQLLALGGDIRFAASQLGARQLSDDITRLPVESLREFTNTLLNAHVDQIVERYHLSLTDAESIGPALLIYVRMAEALGATELLVSGFTLRDAVLNEMASQQQLWSREFQRQIYSSAVELGRRFLIDEPHGRHVAELAQRLFRELEDEHRLIEPRFELILQVAAVLHESGLFVGPRGYHKHSYYLIINSEIFGLPPEDLRLAALVARYHRGASPKTTHEAYTNLTRFDRIVVSKLAAILRVADAMDHSKSQQVDDFSVEVDNRTLVVSIPGLTDLSLEQLELRQKGSLFEETYGLKVLLRPDLSTTPGRGT